MENACAILIQPVYHYPVVDVGMYPHEPSACHMPARSRAARRRQRQRVVRAKRMLAGQNGCLQGMNVAYGQQDSRNHDENLEGDAEYEEQNQEFTDAPAFLCGMPMDLAENTELAGDIIAQLEDGDADKRRELVEWMAPAAKQLAMTSQGCRILQKVIEVVHVSDRSIITKQLESHVVELYESPHGNYVLAKMIEVMPPSAVVFVAEQIQGRAATTARHRFGCRVIERLVEHCSDGQLCGLLEEITADVEGLSRHPYGNFVVQHLLEHGTKERRTSIVQHLLPVLPILAVHRTASHVVQRAFDFSDEAGQKTLVERFLQADGPNSLEEIARSRYGCFVVEQLTRSRPYFTSIQARLQEDVGRLQESHFGARVIEAFKLSVV